MDENLNQDILDKLTKVCICTGVPRSTMKRVIREGADTLEKVQKVTGAGSGGCGGTAAHRKSCSCWRNTKTESGNRVSLLWPLPPWEIRPWPRAERPGQTVPHQVPQKPGGRRRSGRDISGYKPRKVLKAEEPQHRLALEKPGERLLPSQSGTDSLRGTGEGVGR